MKKLITLTLVAALSYIAINRTNLPVATDQRVAQAHIERALDEHSDR